MKLLKKEWKTPPREGGQKATFQRVPLRCFKSDRARRNHISNHCSRIHLLKYAHEYHDFVKGWWLGPDDGSLGDLFSGWDNPEDLEGLADQKDEEDLEHKVDQTNFNKKKPLKLVVDLGDVEEAEVKDDHYQDDLEDSEDGERGEDPQYAYDVEDAEDLEDANDPDR